jgi:hypothetical protein
MKTHSFTRLFKSIFGVALCATGAMLVFASAASTPHWALIDGTRGRWWVDTSSIQTVKRDDGSVWTLFDQTMSTKAAVPPGDGPGHDFEPSVEEAIDCATGHLFTYDDEREKWGKEESKWPPEYFASVRHIVCKQ